MATSLQEKYREYLKSDHWKRTRTSKLARTSRCAICGSLKRLDVHHLIYRDWYNVKMSDLRVLCRRCHELAHQLMAEGKLKYQSYDHNSRFSLTKNAVRKALSGVVDPVKPVRRRVRMSFTVTSKWLETHKSPAGGFTARQLEAIGVSWPPPKGWARDVVGEEISRAERMVFEAPTRERQAAVIAELLEMDAAYRSAVTE